MGICEEAQWKEKRWLNVGKYAEVMQITYVKSVKRSKRAAKLIREE